MNSLSLTTSRIIAKVIHRVSGDESADRRGCAVGYVAGSSYITLEITASKTASPKTLYYICEPVRIQVDVQVRLDRSMPVNV